MDLKESTRCGPRQDFKVLTFCMSGKWQVSIGRAAQTTGKVGIGTTDAQQHSLFVVGSTNITDEVIVGGGLTAVGIGSFQSDVYIDNQLYVGGINITGGASIGEDVTTRNIEASKLIGVCCIAQAACCLQ